MSKQPGQNGARSNKTVKIRCERSPQYRVLVVDGAYGGLGSDGLIRATVFSQSPPLPDRFEQEVGADDQLLSEKAIGAGEPQRNYEAQLVLQPEVAFKLGVWLLQHAHRAGVAPELGDEEAPTDAAAEGDER